MFHNIIVFYNKCFITILKWLTVLYAHINTKHFFVKEVYTEIGFECCSNHYQLLDCTPDDTNWDIESHIWVTECCQDSNFILWLAEKFVHDYLRKSGFVCTLDSVVGGKHLKVWWEDWSIHYKSLKLGNFTCLFSVIFHWYYSRNQV